MKIQAIAGIKIRRSTEAGGVAGDTPSRNTPAVSMHWQEEQKQVELPRALISAFMSSAGPVCISFNALSVFWEVYVCFIHVTLSLSSK